MTNIDDKNPPIPGEDQDEKKANANNEDADSAFDDLNIEIDESELEYELNGPPPLRKT
jgi:hypothetical protein